MEAVGQVRRTEPRSEEVEVKSTQFQSILKERIESLVMGWICDKRKRIKVDAPILGLSN